MDYLGKLQDYRKKEIEVYSRLDLQIINEVMKIFDMARKDGKHFFICGNGGSASTASHFAGDFNKGLGEKYDKKYNFECLSDNISTFMAIANDIGYDEIFRMQLEKRIEKGDILIGISGSGNSKNVVNAFQYAKDNGATTVAIVGYDGGKLKKMADYCIHVDINDMQISEDIHLIINHMMMSVFYNSQ